MEVKWIKIVTDVFSDEKILLMETLPEGDSIIAIWFKLLCLAGKSNRDGFLMMSDKIPYTDEMLSTIFRKPLNIVQIAMRCFVQFEMIEIIEDAYRVANWEKHQNIEGLEKIKEQNRIRQQRYRQKKLIECNEVTEKVTSRHGTDIEVEVDKEEIKDIVAYLNEKSGKKYKYQTPKTKEKINARFNEHFTVDDFKKVIDTKCKEWLGTENEKWIRPETLFGTKFEGYLNQKTVEPKPKNSFHNFKQTEPDYTDEELHDLLKEINNLK